MSSSREDIRIPSHGEELAGWFFAPPQESKSRSPCIILAHGLGAIKEMRLDAYAERFCRAGFACIVFDYRYFGGSTGKPRGLLDIKRQREDWDSAIDYAIKHPDVDPDRIGLFGTSFSGGHVIRVASTGLHAHRVKAVVSQCPFTDGFASSFTVGWSVIPKMALLAIRDVLFGTDEHPVRVPLAGKVGEVALLNAPDVYDGYHGLLPTGMSKLDVEAVPARLVLSLPLDRPGAYASQVKTPILFGICKKDSVAPAPPTLKYAKKAPKGTIKEYDAGHFDVYVGDSFERVIQDYLDFYKEHL